MGLFKMIKNGYDVYRVVVKPTIKVVNMGLKMTNATIETNNIMVKSMNQLNKGDIEFEIKKHFDKFKYQMPDDIKVKFENRIFYKIKIGSVSNIVKTVIGGVL